MKSSIASAEVIIDPRRAKTNGAFPLKLRITYQRIQKYYKLKLDATQAFWEEVQAGRQAKSHNAFREAVEGVQTKANLLLQAFDKKGIVFDFDLFEKGFFGEALTPIRERQATQDAYNALEQLVNQLQDEDRASTAMSYANALQSFRKYQPTLTFREITPKWLENYESAMLANGRSTSTVGIYLRALRIVVNQAVDKGTITQNDYPFGKKRYQIPVGRNIKKALYPADIKAIRAYSLKPGSNEDRHRDMWVFSYVCNGINPKDIFRLTWRNIDGDMMRFHRKKTQRTSRANPIRIDVVITEPVQAIIDKWGNPDRSPDALIFPLFAANLTAREWDSRARDLIKQMNGCTKRIGEALQLRLPLSGSV